MISAHRNVYLHILKQRITLTHTYDVTLFEAMTAVSGLPKTKQVTLSIIVIIVFIPQCIYSFIHPLTHLFIHSPFKSVY
jgi:hypothetical protein